MRLSRLMLIMFILALVAAPAAADCGNPHGDDQTATEATACCGDAEAGADCRTDCPHGADALELAEAAENGDDAAMEKLIAMVAASGHEEAVTLAGKAGGGCDVSRAALIAMVKEHMGGQSAQTASMTELAEAAGQGCAKSTAGLIAAAKKSDNQEMVDLATAAEGGNESSKAALIAMVTHQSDSSQK